MSYNYTNDIKNGIVDVFKDTSETIQNTHTIINDTLTNIVTSKFSNVQSTLQWFEEDFILDNVFDDTDTTYGATHPYYFTDFDDVPRTLTLGVPSNLLWEGKLRIVPVYHMNVIYTNWLCKFYKVSSASLTVELTPSILEGGWYDFGTGLEDTEEIIIEFYPKPEDDIVGVSIRIALASIEMLASYCIPETKQRLGNISFNKGDKLKLEDIKTPRDIIESFNPLLSEFYSQIQRYDIMKAQHLLEIRQTVDDIHDGVGCHNTCITACASNCGSACSSDCGVACTSSCSVGCSLSCTGDCNILCGGACSSDCTGNCARTCTGNCSGACGGTCMDNCTGVCIIICGGMCGGVASYQCATCGTACGTVCTSCSGGCKDTCKSGCYSQSVYGAGAATNCTGCTSGCTGGCIGCTGGCKNRCFNSCTGTCGKGSCTNGCGSACSGICGVGCDMVCKTTCKDTCSADTCTNSCSSSCANSCKDVCSGSLCSTNCGYSCSTNCSKNCTTSCITNCKTTCLNSCFSGCNNSARLN